MDRFREARLVLLCADLAGFMRATAALEPLEVAALLDAYYERAAATVSRHSGWVVKYMGDACLAVFPEDRCAEAVDCAIELTRELHPGPGAGPGLVAGANVHLGMVAEGALGAGAYDVVGAEVNNLFRMGSGPGVRISEPVYHKLPHDRRARWREQSRPITYAFDPRAT